MSGIVVLGADGMLGHKMFQRLSVRFPGTRGTLRTSKADARFADIALLQSDAIVDGMAAMDEVYRQIRAVLVGA